MHSSLAARPRAQAEGRAGVRHIAGGGTPAGPACVGQPAGRRPQPCRPPARRSAAQARGGTSAHGGSGPQKSRGGSFLLARAHKETDVGPAAAAAAAITLRNGQMWSAPTQSREGACRSAGRAAQRPTYGWTRGPDLAIAHEKAAARPLRPKARMLMRQPSHGAGFSRRTRSSAGTAGRPSAPRIPPQSHRPLAAVFVLEMVGCEGGKALL